MPSSTARNTDGTRHRPIRRSRATSGASTKLSRIASVIGISTSRPTYKAAITTTETASVIMLLGVGVSAASILVFRPFVETDCSGMGIVPLFVL